MHVGAWGSQLALFMWAIPKNNLIFEKCGQTILIVCSQTNSPG